MIEITQPGLRRKARIEIIPLIDIIFFLLATFVLVSMSMVKNQGVPIRLPVAITGRTLDRAESMIIRISKEGNVTVDKRDIRREALSAELDAFQKSGPDARVVIQGDADVSYGQVITILDAVRKAGISKVAVQTTKGKA